jgi:hypothetical protein
VLWNYVATSGIPVDTVTINEVTNEYPGKEIVVGSNDKKIYVLNSTGYLIWDFATGDWVRGIGVGNLTADPGNEVVGGTRKTLTTTNLYILNFEYFPTNAILDIGGDGDADWSYPGKFRTTSSASNNSEFQQFLNSCTAVNENCDVPLVFHSDFSGNLNITGLTIDYQYNITDIVSYTVVSAWSRTNEIRVNSSVGSKIKNITYSRNPALDIQFRYVKINSSATSCDFNSISRQNSTFGGNLYCDISSSPRTIPSSGNLGYDTLWDNTMDTGIPLLANESTQIIVSGFWKKNVTVWNETTTNFTNIIANSSVNETAVVAESKIKVEWYQNGTFYDITPSVSQTNCNSTNPTYTSTQVGNDTFYACKQDTNSNGLPDFFIWKQPYTKDYIKYELSGSGNNVPALNNVNVTPSNGTWNSKFNITVNVTDVEGDNVSV